MVEESASRFDILDLINESVIARDLNHCITYWNAGAEKLYGWSKAQAIGQNTSQLLHCSEPELFTEREAQLLRDGVWHGDIHRNTAKGRRQVEIDLTLRIGADGQPVEIIETSWDVTERREKEEAARLDAYRFRVLFETTEVAFWEIDINDVSTLLRSIFTEGVTDLGTYLLEHPEVVREMMARARVLDVNRKALEMFGVRDRADMVGRGVERYWPPGSEPMLVEALMGTRAHGSQFISEARLADVHGRPIDVLYTASSSPESQKRGVTLLAMVDIGQRKRAAEQLEASELRYRTIFNEMPISFWEVETQGFRAMFHRLRAEGVTSIADHVAQNPEFVAEALDAIIVRHVNNETLRLMGATNERQLVGPISRFWTDTAGFVRAADASYKGLERISSVSTLTSCDGRAVDIFFTLVFANEQSAGGKDIIGAIDITEQRKAVRALHTSERKYRDLFNYMPIALWQLDANEMRDMFDELREAGVDDLLTYVDEHPEFLDRAQATLRITEANEQALRLFGASDRAELLGVMPSLWVDREDWAGAAIARLSGAVSYSKDSTIRRIDGSEADVMFSVAFADPNDSDSRNLVGAIDIGDRIRAERLLQQVQAEFAHAARVSTLGELTASIAHEVNQPLAAIVTNSEASLRWLARETPDLDEVRSLAKRIVADADRAAEIISQIRQMASPQPPVQEVISIQRVVDQAVQFVRRELESRDVQVRITCADPAIEVRADRTQIQQVVVNLAMNAAQAMLDSESGERLLYLRILPSDEFVSVEVEDTGPGLPTDHIAKVFDSFFTTKADGLGIGLAICRSIIEAHGGQIIGENRTLGACFRFTLPRLCQGG